MNTTTALQTFDFHTNSVRVHVEGEHVEYCAKDIAAALGYKDTTNAIKQHCRGVVNRHPILDSLGRTQEAVFIGEGDVYRLIASSKLPAAVEFEHWLFDEVLPSIRRHGGYMMGQESMSPEEMALASLKWLQSVVDEQKRQIEAQKPKVVFADALTASNKDILVGELAKVLKGSVEASFSKKIAGGFTIGPKDGGYFISFTEETFNALISEYLRPATKKILFG